MWLRIFFISFIIAATEVVGNTTRCKPQKKGNRDVEERRMYNNQTELLHEIYID